MARTRSPKGTSYSTQKSNGANLDFEQKMTRLSRELKEQFAESTRFESVILQNLRSLGFGE